jgi:hypothetical protein
VRVVDSPDHRNRFDQPGRAHVESAIAARQSIVVEVPIHVRAAAQRSLHRGNSGGEPGIGAGSRTGKSYMMKRGRIDRRIVIEGGESLGRAVPTVTWDVLGNGILE